MLPPTPTNCDAQRVILVVDDEPSTRGLVAGALHSAGFSVYEAATVGKGQQLLRQYGDAVVLAIISMVLPGMDGLNLAAEFEHAGVRVLLTWGETGNITMDGLLLRFPELVLAKPFSPEDLLSCVSALL